MSATGMLRRVGMGAVVAAGVAATSPTLLGAQEPRTPCVQCDQDARRAEAEARRDAARDVAREIRAARRDIQRLSRRESNAAMKQALREADSALDRVDPTSRGAATAVRRVIERLAAQPQMHAPDHAEAYGDVMRQLASLQAQLTVAALRRSMAADAAPRAQRTPAGWLGIAYSGEPSRSEPGRGSYLYFKTYPVIEAVDPGSPAAAAGLEAGDTIVAFGGRDVRKRKIFLSEVLRPGNQLWVRVQRSGRTRDARVAVKARPKIDPANEPYVARVVPRPRTEPRYPLPPTPPGDRVIEPVPPPTMGLLPGPGAFIWSGPSAVAGAELAKMSSDLREVLDAPEGVLVLNVGRGTPASNAGLRGGDVILRVDGKSTTSPAAVQRAVQRAHDGDERRVELDVVRRSERRTVVLKW